MRRAVPGNPHWLGHPRWATLRLATQVSPPANPLFSPSCLGPTATALGLPAKNASVQGWVLDYPPGCVLISSSLYVFGGRSTGSCSSSSKCICMFTPPSPPPPPPSLPPSLPSLQPVSGV
eukprot:scaffold3152_cov67-Phaeocystis_antarctica.AAC.2